MRHAISLALELTNKYAGEVYISESGHLEFAFSASAGPAIHKAFGTPLGEAFGFMAGSPAAIGLVMADNAVKSAAVSITQYMTPNIGTSHSNEVIIAISGDASAVKAAVLEGRQTGLELLIGMGTYPEIPVRRICKISGLQEICEFPHTTLHETHICVMHTKTALQGSAYDPAALYFS